MHRVTAPSDRCRGWVNEPPKPHPPPFIHRMVRHEAKRLPVMVIGKYKIPMDEAIAAAMLLGEPAPILCLRCAGSGRMVRLFGTSTCDLCDAEGFYYIGRKTMEYCKS